MNTLLLINYKAEKIPTKKYFCSRELTEITKRHFGIVKLGLFPCGQC